MTPTRLVRRPSPLTLIVLSVLLVAPAPLSAQPTDGAEKYWLLFRDKLDATGTVAQTAPGYVSERAWERRRRRGRCSCSKLDAPLSPVYLDAIARRGITPLVESRWLNGVSAVLDAEQVEAVRRLPFVRAVHPVGRALPAKMTEAPPSAAALLPLATKPTGLDYGQSLAQLAFINAVEPLENGINGQGVLLGFIDTEYGGFQHPTLSHIVDDGRLVADSNFVGQSQSDRHGRRVASIAVGFEEGVLIGPAYGATVIAATTEYAPSETNQEEDNLVRALEWMERQGVEVVNISLGYNIFDAGERNYTKDDLDGDTGVTTRAADAAAALGVVVVNSAGNEGGNSWDTILTPADADSIITVGAATGDSLRASFSSIGPTADGRTKPDVSALGVGVINASSSTGVSGGNGTSFATPLVAGVVAQILQVNPDLTPIDVRDLLRETASQSTNEDDSLGWGIINAAVAVQQAAMTGTHTETAAVPTNGVEVRAPYPNPFATETVLEVHAASTISRARLSLYNVLGQEVQVPFEGALHPGLNRLVISAADLPPGLYLYRLHGPRITQGGTMVVMR